MTTHAVNPAGARVPRALTLLAGLVAALAAGVAVVQLLRVAATSPDTQFDDAYMTLRYAKHLAAGHGLVWNRGEAPVYGATSLLHVAALTGLELALPQAGDALLLKLSSLVPALLAALALALVGAGAGGARARPLVHLVWTALLLVSPLYRYHALTGMDTMLAVLCNTLVIGFTLRAARRAQGRALLPLAVVGYLAFLARPDSGLYVVLFPALFLLLATERAGGRRLALMWLAIIGGVLALDALAKWAALGDPVPLSFYMKSHTFKAGYAGRGDWNPVAYFFEFVSAFLPVVVVFIACAHWRQARVMAPFAAAAALTLAYLSTTVQVMGFHARFYVPTLPFLVVPAAWALNQRLFAPADARPAGGVLAFLLRVALVVLVWLALPRAGYHLSRVYDRLRAPDPAPLDERAFYATPAAAPLPALDWWPAIEQAAATAAQLPDGSAMALTELGLVGARAPGARVIDLTGLHNRRFAKTGFSADALFDLQPDLIWLPHPHYVDMRGAILTSDRFWNDYDLFAGMWNFGVAVRRDGPRRTAIEALVRDSWRAHHPGIDIEAHRATRMTRTLGAPAP